MESSRGGDKQERIPLVKRPTHPTIVAYLALFVALGGTAYAAATIGSAEIKDNSIRGKDIRRDTPDRPRGQGVQV